MMHLKYPRKRGFLYWDELGCLARALGFHEKIFLHHLPDELMIGQLGLTIITLYEGFDIHKSFHTALDRTYNIHTDEWNISAIRKAVQLLDKHVFTFEEIELIRITYQVYESQDTRGLQLQEKILQRVIKMCDRMISPLKMMQRVKHMAQHFEESDRIQLHEFMGLLLWCELYQGIAVKVGSMNITKNEEELFELEDFEEMLSYYDQRLAQDLDQRYMEEEWKFTKERFGSKCLPKDVPPVDPQIRKKQVRYHSERYRFLYREITDSSKRVVISKAGYVRGRPVSAPDMLMYQYIDPSVALSTLHPRPRSVRDVFGHVIRPSTAESTVEDVRQDCPRPQLEEYQRPSTPIAVTPQDMAHGHNKISTLKFEMETVEMKYKQMLNEDLDFLVPGYRGRKKNKPQTPPPTPPPKPKKEPHPSQETIDKLADPHRRRMPGPSHARVCDARFRGWYEVKARRGPHFVLTSSQFDRSPNGLMLAKLQKHSDDEIKREPVVYRFTQRHQATLDERRPWTSPAVMVKGDLSTPPLESFPKSEFSTGQGLEAGTDSSKQTTNESFAEGIVSLNERNGEEHGMCSGASSEVGWNDLAVYHEEETSESSGKGSNESAKSNDESASQEAIQTYLPPPKGEFKWKGNDFHSRYARLEKIKELQEEEDDKSVVCVDAPVGEITRTKSGKQSKCTQTTAVRCTKSQFSQEKPAKTKDDASCEKKSDKSSKKDTPGRTRDKNDVFGAWFYGNKKAKQYPWIQEIVSTDFSHRWSQQQQDYNFYRLTRRGQGCISKEFKRKLMSGIPA